MFDYFHHFACKDTEKIHKAVKRLSEEFGVPFETALTMYSLAFETKAREHFFEMAHPIKREPYESEDDWV